MVIKAGETAHNTRTVHPRAFRAASSPLPCRTLEWGPQVSRSARSRKALARADSAESRADLRKQTSGWFELLESLHVLCNRFRLFISQS